MKPSWNLFNASIDSIYLQEKTVEQAMLDLAERAAMAINGIAGGIDQDLDHQMWFLINYACNPGRA